jgi:hypothetical protein
MITIEAREKRVRRGLARYDERLWKRRGEFREDWPYAVVDIGTNGIVMNGLNLKEVEAYITHRKKKDCAEGKAMIKKGKAMVREALRGVK